MAISPTPFAATGDVLTATNFNLLPRGVVAYASKTADQTGITTATDVTGLSVSFTATSSRYYRTTVFFIGTQVGGLGNAYAYITDGSSSKKAQAQWTMASGYYLTMEVTVIETGLSGSVTRKARAEDTVAGSLTISAASTYPAYILVEDIGGA